MGVGAGAVKKEEASAKNQCQVRGEKAAGKARQAEFKSQTEIRFWTLSRDL